MHTACWKLDTKTALIKGGSFHDHTVKRLEPMALIFSGWKVEGRKAPLRNSCSPYFPYFRAPKRIVGSTVVDR